jgi:hypothetical protein
MKNCQGGGGCFRAVAAQVGLEASVGLYKHSDLRAIDAGDMFVAGINCWGRDGYTIGTPVTGYCLNITDGGAVHLQHSLTAEEVLTDTIRASAEEFITINENTIITGNLRVDGILEGNANPFWIAGKFASNGTTVLTSRGRYPFTVSRNGTGYYTITPNTPFLNTNYIVSATCQADGQNANARIVNASLTTTSFAILAYNNNVATDQIVHFSVIA